MPTLRIALAQCNFTVGDLQANRRRVADGILQASAWQADLVVFPELSLTGYPPEDLLLKASFVEENLLALKVLEPLTRGIAALVGVVDRDRQGLFDAAAILVDGRHAGTYHKQCLPNYGVFDEQRYFLPGDRSVVLTLRGMRIGVTICEDLWQDAPAAALAQAGCQWLVNLSASPYHAGKLKQRQALFAERARRHRLGIAYCNLVGGQDELVFDGASFMLDPRGRLLATGRQFREDMVLADVPVVPPPVGRLGGPTLRLRQSQQVGGSVTVVPVGLAAVNRPALEPTQRPPRSSLDEVYDALVLGTRDYVRKNAFDTVVLGLSGGVDSALTACIAADALGSDRVVGMIMPSRFSSTATQADARRLAKALRIRCEELSIEPCFRAFLKTLEPLFRQRPWEVTEQNIQARIRGALLMALSNKFGWLVLTTGNKSEMATGYCTLYGDMAGGFAVIKDVPKTLVYRLARRRGTVIPERVFTRAPTAELAPHQTDQDTLPPYEVLDQILKRYVEEDRSARQMLAGGRFDADTVARVITMVDHSEYKRRQAPPGVKITPKAFGRDRRMPITNRYQNE